MKIEIECRPCRWAAGAVGALLSTWGAAVARASAAGSALLAQAAPPTLPTPPADAGSKSYLVEAAVVVVLFGLALFAVCRSSRRG